MKVPGNYTDLFERVDMYVDNSLPKEDEHDFLKQAIEYPAASRHLYAERSFKSFIKNKLPRKKVSPEILSRIVQKIQHD